MAKIRIKIDYYDNEQRDLFSKYSNYEDIKRIVDKTIEVEQSEFLTYMLFKEQKESAGFRTYKELASKVTSREGFFGDYLDFSGGTVRAKFHYKDMDGGITERIGVAGSLCVANQIHKLTEADWEKIPEQGGKNAQKTLDFRKASDGKNYIYVESKGSVLEDNTKKGTTVSNHKRDIKDKKMTKKDGCFSGISYGVISVIDDRLDSTMQCWLVDPYSPYSFMEPGLYRLLSRLYFYWGNLREITPNSSILLSLRNRINILERASNYKDFDRCVISSN